MEISVDPPKGRDLAKASQLKICSTVLKTGRGRGDESARVDGKVCVGGDGDVDGGWVVKVLCRQSTAATVQAASSGLP